MSYMIEDEYLFFEIGLYYEMILLLGEVDTFTFWILGLLRFQTNYNLHLFLVV